jgi:hypothetical protein
MCQSVLTRRRWNSPGKRCAPHARDSVGDLLATRILRPACETNGASASVLCVAGRPDAYIVEDDFDRAGQKVATWLLYVGIQKPEDH